MAATRVSMAGFQRAYADLAASPRLCLAVRDDPGAALAAYDLTERERGRLARAVWQKGMDANCTLYRATRITALNAVLPRTLARVGPALRPLLDGYWEAEPVHDVRFVREAARFVGWLAARPDADGAVLALARAEIAAEEARLSAV